jgi:hypothetical protein
MKLLTVGNTKTMKGEAFGYQTYILHLAPADLSGYETCPKRTSGCTAACLNTAGRGGMFKPGGTNTIQEARKRKTRQFFEQRDEFIAQLKQEIAAAIKSSKKKNLVPVFRLNGTSDLSFEKYGIFESFPDVQFYDYTKIIGRKVSHIPNYHLTFSAADGNDRDVERAIAAGMNVAVVFGLKKTQPLPEAYLGRPVFNGDDSDLRFLDPQGVIVGLYAKGRARKDTSGFVKIVPIQGVTLA